MKRRRTRTAAAAAAAVAGVLGFAACGSTVQAGDAGTAEGAVVGDPSSSLGGAEGGALGAVAPGTPGAEAPGTPGATPGGAAPAGAPAGPGAATPGDGAGGSGNGGPASGGGQTPGPGELPAEGPGWDEKRVYIGVTTQKDVQTVADGLGLGGFDVGDQEVIARAVAEEINRQGGIFGREISLVFRDQRTVETQQDPNTAGSAACTYFTQDRPVVALLNPVTLMDVPAFRSCMAKAKVPLFSASVASVDDQVAAALSPYFYQSVAPSWNALAPVLVRQLKAGGWFAGWNVRTGTPSSAFPVKVGILADGSEAGGRVAALVQAALSAVGSNDSIVFQAGDPSQMSPAVLQFSGRGVTHVISVTADLLPFQIAAASQNYRPRYGISSYNAPQTFLETSSPQGQNNGALGVGWSPSLDVSDANDPGDTGPGERDCKKVLAAAGQTFKGKRLGEAVALAFCDGIKLIAGGAVAGGGLSGQRIHEGVMAIAPKFSAGFSFANALSPGRLFVPGGVRGLAWVTSCSCFRYTSGVSRL
jgi:ABC-type branched-subunit amino acid transport system substrate-binding protein